MRLIPLKVSTSTDAPTKKGKKEANERHTYRDTWLTCRILRPIDIVGAVKLQKKKKLGINKVDGQAEVRRKSIGHSGIEDCRGPAVSRLLKSALLVCHRLNQHQIPTKGTLPLFFGGETKGGYSKQTQKLKGKGVERGDRDRRQLEIVDQLLCVYYMSLSVCVFGRPET